ncbi:MAG: calcineurin-like phosphoesterase family protein [Bacteroidales bacterium]|nr:calcineurin-like phosphoesterase family protein [Bacteroidales bacterium]
MKNALQYLLIPVLVCFTAACARETVPDMTGDEDLVEIHISASAENTKTVLGPDFHAHLWAEGDKIAIYDGGAIREFTLVSGAGTQSAVFTGRVSSSSTSFIAVSPYSAARLNNRVVTQSVPDQQNVVSGADPAALVMRAECARGSVLQFSNQTSLVKFTVPEGVDKVSISVLDGGNLAGDGSSTVSVNLPGTAGSYAAVVNPGEYKGISVVLKAGAQNYTKSSPNTLVAARSAGCNLGTLELGDPAIIITTPAELAAFLGSSTASTKDVVMLAADIDMSGTDFTPAADFAGSLEGQGHVISGASKPLFTDNHGTLNNFTLTGSYTPGSNEFAPVALTNHGSISAVKVNVNVNRSVSAAASAPVVIGGIVAWNYGPLDGCSADGSVSFVSTSSIAAVAIGGLAGYSEAPFGNCTNNAAVTLSARNGSGMTALGRIGSSASNVGGIVGAAYAGFSATECVNNGAVTYLNDAIQQLGAVVYQRSQIGGIAGSPYGDIVDCRNTGAISVTAKTSDGVAYADANYIFDVGGISGGSFHETAVYTSENDHTNITGCINEGNIDVYIDASKSNSPVGGIVGWPSGEHTGLANKVSNCSNSGSISMQGFGKVRIGGVMGGTGSLEYCTNSGRIYVDSADANSAVGGIAGFHSQDHGLYACTNTGDIVSRATIFGLGGLIGCHGGVDLTSSAACKVLCNVDSGASDRSGVGMVLGTYNKETSKKVVLGTAEEPIEVKGSVSVSGKGTELNSANYKNFLSGTTYTSTSHVINAYCETPAPANLYYAEGSVKYTDGSPAAGVSVSDGFSVVVTDSEGNYRLTTSTDTWYIYISMPSDAVIEKKSDGRPDFFTRYEYPNTRYDFTLKRQEVETQFLLFAFADPQAHNANRGTGKADTSRFNEEAVPAINACIAQQSLPCYGVTLGDIVYSEGSRNSNGGMTTMRTHFGKVNMPVFQTMGNHDFTFFYGKSNPLTVDDASSTLHLRAQRKFEDAFGPINFSFNRGDVHVICMRDIIYDSNTDASSYHCGYTDEQWAWLQADLANVPKTKKVILCGHIPFTNNTSGEHISDALNLIKQYKGSQVFSGHTHYKRYTANLASSGVPDHIHSAVCGQWWWSNIEGDGAPNGYTVYRINGTAFTDEYFLGFNTHMNTRDYQLRVYRGNLKNGGSTCYFQWPHDASRLFINVFNGDSRWTVKVYENGTLGGTASLMSYSRQTMWDGSTTSCVKGTTYTVNTSSNQDWWAIGYNIGVLGRGTGNTSYFTSMFHMYTYTLKNPDATIRVDATDSYGNTYSCSEVISTDSWYPAYVKYGNAN